MMTTNPSRRRALKALGVTAGGCALAGALSPLASFAEGMSTEELLQAHFSELSPEDLQRVLRRLEAETQERTGREVNITADPPIEGVQFGYALNLSVCVGCRRCAEACHQENNHDRRTHNSYPRVFEMGQGSIDLSNASVDYDHPVPAEGRFYMPVQCQQCENPPCVRACPTRATWQEADGVTVVDYNWCIGCRYCMAACPYGARRFNWAHVTLPDADLNPSMHYLGNRPRMYGVVEKCTFCIQRTRLGYEPACVTVCPVGARKFGDVNDPTTEVHYIVNRVRTIQLKHDLGTEPRFYYYVSAGLG
jgi:molybdopterin-containing oxidoreductase family iron-sulfur binding subunit